VGSGGLVNLGVRQEGICIAGKSQRSTREELESAS
jgi:hypothetical protein